jgi:hypothetical protein
MAALSVQGRSVVTNRPGRFAEMPVELSSHHSEASAANCELLYTEVQRRCLRSTRGRAQAVPVPCVPGKSLPPCCRSASGEVLPSVESGSARISSLNCPDSSRRSPNAREPRRTLLSDSSRDPRRDVRDSSRETKVPPSRELIRRLHQSVSWLSKENIIGRS